MCGESSTHYTKLPDYPFAVDRMAKSLTSPKLIYVMRHPVDRLVSHYIHQWTQNIFTCDINAAIDQYEELTAYSCYARQLAPYFER
ncbi:MAG TPA: sulfotransferase, partial [Methylococcaceae bacterium]|nr:sulfotransferase [Methylococcaceae bacterium]